MASTSPPPKRPRTAAPNTSTSTSTTTYTLLYHPSIPGRGEYIRLALEATSTPYTDLAVEQGEAGYKVVQAACDAARLWDEDGNPPCFAPPVLRVEYSSSSSTADGEENKEKRRKVLIHQTPNILAFLGERLGLDGGDGDGDGDGDGVQKYLVGQLALTALDLGNETHDVHHPIDVADYYENQKEEALRKSKSFREARIPKFFSYFERTLKGNAERNSGGAGAGIYLVGGQLTYADLTLWQVLDGLMFAFPNEINARKTEFPHLFEHFYPGIKDKHLSDYLASQRRQKYSMGIFRHYPELDRE